MCSSVSDTTLYMQIYDPLLAFDSNNEVEYYLAKSYDVSDDGLTYTFHLQENVKFHNGDPLKASDVVFTIKRAMESPYISSMVADVADAAAPDDLTVAVTLSAPNAAFLKNMESIYILDEAVVTEAGDSYGSNPVGTGAYKFVSYETANAVQLTRNDDYFMGAPDIKDVTYRVITDVTTATVGIQAGDIDYGVVESASYTNIENDKNLKMEGFDSPTTYFVVMNNQAAPFSDVRVRQAISYACDREFMIDCAANGFGTVARSMINPVVFGDTSKINDPYSYDKDKAASLLAEAGVSSLNVTIKSFGAVDSLAQVLQQNLADVGITATIASAEQNTFLEEVFAGDFEIAVMAASLEGDYDTFSILFDPASIGGFNMARYDNPDVTALFAKGRTTTNLEERAEIYTELFNTIGEDAPYVPIFYPTKYYAYDAGLKIDDFNNGVVRVMDIHWN